MLNSFFVVILFFSLNIAQGAELKCFSGQIRYKVFGKTINTKATYCSNSSKDVLYSKSCLNSSCYALSSNIDVDRSSFYSEVGKPGFKLCRELGGEPQIIEFLVGKNWYKLDKCLFSADGSFVDTGTLVKSYFD